jgi:hypothetical protein
LANRAFGYREETITSSTASSPPAWRKTQTGKPAVFKRGIVVTVYIVNTYDFVLFFRKMFCQMAADKSGCAGYKYFHFPLLPYSSEMSAKLGKR